MGGVGRGAGGGGCETPEMVELAGVVIDLARPWQIKDVTDLVRPALDSPG